MSTLQLVLEALPRMKLEHGTHLPETRLPALHPFSAIETAASGVQKLASIETAVESGETGVSDLLSGFARFVAALGGLEELAFGFSAGPAQHSIVHAAVTENSSIVLQVVDGETEDGGLDFLLELKLEEEPAISDEDNNTAVVQGPENTKAFTLSLTRTSLRLAYPQDFVPAAAAPHLLAAAKSFLFPASTTTTIASALNHPPLQTPLDLATRVSTNESAVFAQAGLLLHSAFEACAERFPDRPALDFLEAFPSTHRVFTYRELNKVAEKVAQELRTVYQSQFGIVPVYMSTSAELYISYLAVLKAGLAFSPLPTDAPQHRLEDILGDIGRGIVLGRGKASAVLTGAVSALGYDINYIDVDSVIRRLPAPPLNVPRTSSETSDPNRLAYVLYTSGSTGKPKGVQITHLSSTCSIASNALTRPLSTNPSEPSRWFQFAAPTFDPSIMEIFVTLSMGGTLCSADRELTLTNIEGVVTKLRADIMMTTPSLAVIMNPNQMPTLRSLVVMGEAVIEKVIAGFASDSPTRGIDLGDEKFTGPRGLANGYGPTEAAINVTLFEVFAGYRGSIIGPPTETCSLFILDPNSKEPIPMAYGLAGELAIGGPQVAVGYLNRPEETEKSFVLSEEYGRLYRTGDKARIVWSESGVPMVDFLGRISDEQVKLSGRRVELGEVDAAVGKVHGVAQVATVVYKENPNAQGSEKLVACVVPDEDGFVEEICDETVAELLPEFMQPWKYLVLPSLPWGSSGKLDRKSIKATVELALRNRVHARTVTTTPLAIVGTADPEQVDLLRRLLAGAVGEEWENVSADTNMISLGLDSLRTMMFLQQARASGIEGLTVTDVLKSKSPIAIASLLHLRKNVVVDATEENVSEKWQKTVENYFERNKVSCSESLGVDALEIEKILPTTATQAGMVSSFLQSEASDGKYVYQTIFKINPGADIAKLRQSWDTVLIRHDAFRMCFVTVDDELSPFSQCVLSASSARNRKEWKITRSDSSNEEEFEKAIDGAAKDAAKSIVPQAAWNISLIQSKTQTAIILSMFHGIFDGGSLNLLIEEVAAEYHGLPAPPRTPIDKAVELHYTSDLLGAKDYWKGNLEGYLPEPFPRLTGVKNSYIKGVTDIVNIKSRISINDLLEKSRVLGASPLSALQAAWAIIISSYSDTQSEDVTFGSVLSGRLDKDSEICMGPTFTTVPTRVNTHEISPDGLGTASAMLQHLSKANISALEFLQPPLLSLVTVDGGLPYNTLLAFQMFSAGGEDSDIWSSVYNPPMANDFAVMVEVWPSSDGSLRFKATYKDDFLNSTGAEIMLRQMDDVLIHMFNSPGDVYSVIRSDVSPDLRSSSNPHPKGSAEPEIGCHRLHAQFEEHAERAPDDKALIFKYSLTQDIRNVEWTYGQLNDRASRLATYLVRNFGPLNDAIVPLCFDKSPILYVTILAVLKAGAGWCPVDPDFPPARRNELIKRTGAGLLLLSDNGKTNDNAVPEEIIIVNVMDALASTEKADQALLTNVKNASKSNHLAYLIWTSGTTGFPKGVPIEHHSAVSSMAALQAEVPSDVEGGVRCLQFSTYTFDVFVQDLFYTFGVGGCLVGANKELTFGYMSELICATKLTHAHLTPAFSAGVDRKSCPTLQVVTMIGEKLGQNVADDWSQNMRAYNTYGPAEATVVSTIRRFGGEEDSIKSENVGTPLTTVSCHVMRNNRVTMKGGVGELALGGPHLARGYFMDPVKTAEKFLWNEELQERIYMTGDVVRYLHDGTIEFVGRTDDQVKLAGIRVELSEISMAIVGCHPKVERIETMYLSRPDRPSKVVVTFVCAPSLVAPENRISGYIITSNAAVEVSDAARAKAIAVLPEYMHPGIIMVVSHIPQTPSAKIDRKALHATYCALDTKWFDRKNQLDQEDAASEGDSKATNHRKLERIVIEHVSALSGVSVDSINISSSLRGLGVDSIRSIRLATRLTKLGYTLSVVDVLHSKNIKALISLIATDQKGHGESQRLKGHGESQRLKNFDRHWRPAVSPKVEANSFDVFPCTPLQEALLSESMQNHSAYWSNNFFTLSHRINLERLHQAWIEVTKKTEALRVAFMPTASLAQKPEGDRPRTFVQIVYPEHEADWSVVEAGSSPLRNVAKDKADEITHRHQNGNYTAPPWAVSVFKRDSEPPVMVLTIHHSIHDGPSLAFLAADVQAAYVGYQIGARTQLSDALRLTIAADDVDEEKNVEFWTRELADFADADAIAFPDLTGKKPDPTKSEGKEYVETSIEISVHALQAASPEFNASEVTSTIRAAYGCTLVDFIEGSTIVIGETLSERIQDATLGDTIAPLITVTPVLLRPHGTPREILEEYSRISLASWKHRHVLPTLVRKLLLRPHDQALYPAMFVFHPGPHNGQSEILDVIWTPMDDVVGLTVEHGLALNVYMEGDGILKLVFTADAALMLNPQLQLIAEQVVALIEAMTKFPDTPVGQLMATFPERILSIARPNVSEAVRTAHVVDPMYWMEHYAENHPDWKAAEVADTITCTGSTTRSWSYAQLNEQANRIAALIDSFNIGRNRMVSLCVPRTLEAYAPIAGVYKAGCGYLSIDEGLPAERKGLLVEDSNSAILFTTFELAETFPVLHAEVRIICIDDVKFINELATFSGANVARNVHQDDISYLLYTSGSTGKPKGVQVSRGNLSAFVESQSDFICREVPATLELGGQGNYLGLASRAFDVHVAEMFLAWRHGLAAVTADRSLLLDDIGLALAQLKITHASFVPSLLDQADLVPGDVPALRFMGVGGEKISQRVVDTWASNETVSLVNAYGPTEVTICCSSLAVSPDSTVRNIGNLLGNITGYVFVPGTFIPTKRGQPGELCITGDLVALGYYQRPDAGGFVDYNGERLYRTGDMVRLMDGDAIEYLGRSDDQAKIRGQRLELGEVSEGIRSSSKEELDVASLILQHPGLSRAQLVCFVARSAHHFVFQDKAPTFLAGDYEVFAQELQTECRKKLPAYMVPDVVIPMNIMPHAAMSGKADAKQLKALFSGIPLSELLHSTASGNNRSVAERELTADEEIIRGLIAAIVSVDAEHIVHVSNIFELGIDSLSAITLSLKMKGLGYNSSVVSVLGNPTIEGLAAIPRKSSREQNIVDRALLDARKSLEGLDARLRPQVSAIANVPESSIVVIRPCLPLQEGIIARSINSESGPIYVNHVTLKLDSKIDADKLRRAWKEAVGANDILRTLFCQPEDAFVQVVLAPDSLNYWNETSITSTEEALANFRPNEVASEIISNIHQRPPIRLHLARSDSSTSLLFISMHHSIYDGQSFLMLLDEVADRYNSVDVEERASFGSLVEHLAAQNIENAQDFWTKSLEGCRPTLVATQTGYREDEAVSIAEHTVSIRLSELEACASHLRCTLPSLSQLVFGILLAQRVGHNDVIFGSVLSGRAATVAGAETIMAPLITTNPQRVQLHSGSSTIADLVEEYQKVNIASLEHQHISLRHIQRWAGADRPLFDTLFSFVHKVSAPGDSLWEEVESSTVADYPFAIEFEADVDADCLVVRIGFTPAYGTAEEVKVVLEKIDLLLQDLSHGESMKLSCLGVSDLNADSQTTVAESFDECSWTTEETTMREVAVEVCGVPIEQVKKSSTFYSLGIDSVTAIRFARMLRKLEIPVSSADVIRFPSIGALSQQIARKASEADAPKVDVPASDIKRLLENTNLTFIDAETVEAVYSCTPLQSGMLTQTLASSDGRLYVHHHCVKLETTTDVSRLQAAWLQVIEKTDILRTVFHHSPELENAWTAVVRKVSPAKVIEEDISGTFDEALLEVAKKVIFTDEAHFQETPVQARLLRGPSDIFFVVSMHHSLYDGVSIPFVFQDLATIYAGEMFSPRRPFSEAAVLIVQNKDSAADYWVQNISDYSVLTLPRLAEEESSDTTHLASLTLEPSSAEILDGCMALGVTLQSVLLLAWGKVLSTLVGRRDVVFGQVVSGRTLPLEGVEGISGPLFNTVPMRIQLAQNLQDNRSLVAQIQRKSAESQSHQHASLRTIQNKWRAASGSTAGSLFDTLFVFQKAMVDEQEDGDRIWSPIDGDEGEVQAEYPFNLEIVQTPKTILLQAAAQGAYLSADGLRNALSQLSGAILDIIQNPSRLATAFPEGLHALPLAISNDEAADESSRTDFNPDEAAIREIISEIASMPIEKITLRESIYAYGIDSISAIRVASACRKRGIQLGVADILQGGHIEGICQRFLKLQASRVAKAPTVKIELVSAAEKTKALSILNIAEETVEKILPVLAGQLFHLDGWLKCGRTFYEPTWTFEARERLDLERLQVCWQALRYRHPILRTVFAAVSPDKAVQVMLKSSTVTESHGWNFRETETDASSAVMKEVYDISRLPADLFTPPVRLTIIRGSDFDGVLFTFHHAVYDAWSMPTMIADLFALYTGSPVESNTGFADFVEFSHTSRSIPDEQQYWSNSLSAAETTLITPSTKPPAPSDGSMQQTFVLAPRVAENFSALDQTCKKAGVMLSSLVLAAFSRALAAKTGTLNPTFGIYQVGRSASFDSLETVAGPCLNLTPVTVPAKLTPQEAALAIQSELGSRVAYEQTPLRDILAWKESKLEFNTFVNLLWHTEKMVEDPKAILKHLKIGVPTDYCSNEPLHGVTSVDALDNGYFPIQGVYLDVGPNLDTDTIDFGVRCDKVLMGDDELREFIAAIGEQIVDAVATLI